MSVELLFSPSPRPPPPPPLVGDRALVGGLSRLSVCDPLDFRLILLESGLVFAHNLECGDLGLVDKASGELSVRLCPELAELETRLGCGVMLYLSTLNTTWLPALEMNRFTSWTLNVSRDWPFT